jgi:hypothetical protein
MKRSEFTKRFTALSLAVLMCLTSIDVPSTALASDDTIEDTIETYDNDDDTNNENGDSENTEDKSVESGETDIEVEALENESSDSKESETSTEETTETEETEEETTETEETEETEEIEETTEIESSTETTEKTANSDKNKMYKIKFLDIEGNELDVQEVEQVSDIELPDAPEVEGYTFKNWDIDLDSLELTEDIEVKSVYEKVKAEEKETIYTIKFLDIDEKVISVQRFKDLADIELPEAPEVEGYEFKNWDIDLDNLDLDSLKSKEIIKVKAIYEKIDTELKLIEQTIKTSISGKTISISGNLPEGARVKASKVTDTSDFKSKIEETVPDNVTVTVHDVFDITILVDDEEYQPEDFGETVQVKITNIKVDISEKEELKVYHVKHDDTLETIDYSLDNNTLQFEADSFSQYGDATLTSEDGDEEFIEIKTYYAHAYFYESTGTLKVLKYYTTGNSASNDYGWGTYKNSIKKVIICDGVTKIGDNSFKNFTAIESLEIADSVTEIGYDAFYGCSGLKGDLDLSHVTTLGYEAFYGCSGFDGTLTLGGGLSTIERYTFKNCSGFTKLVLPSSVTEIGFEAFRGCYSLKGNLDLSHVTTLGGSTFYDCYGFDGTLTLSNQLTSINGNFYNCYSFTGNLVIPDSVTKIGNGSFYNCKGFTGNLIIPDSVTEIEYTAFSGCSGFSGKLKLGKGLTSLGSCAFYNCYNISEIDLTDCPLGATSEFRDNIFYVDSKYKIQTTVTGWTIYDAEDKSGLTYDCIEANLTDNNRFIGKNVRLVIISPEGSEIYKDYKYVANTTTLDSLVPSEEFLWEHTGLDKDTYYYYGKLNGYLQRDYLNIEANFVTANGGQWDEGSTVANLTNNLLDNSVKYYYFYVAFLYKIQINYKDMQTDKIIDTRYFANGDTLTYPDVTSNYSKFYGWIFDKDTNINFSNLRSTNSYLYGGGFLMSEEKANEWLEAWEPPETLTKTWRNNFNISEHLLYNMYTLSNKKMTIYFDADGYDYDGPESVEVYFHDEDEIDIPLPTAYGVVFYNWTGSGNNIVQYVNNLYYAAVMDLMFSFYNTDSYIVGMEDAVYDKTINIYSSTSYTDDDGNTFYKETYTNKDGKTVDYVYNPETGYEVHLKIKVRDSAIVPVVAVGYNKNDPTKLATYKIGEINALNYSSEELQNIYNNAKEKYEFLNLDEDLTISVGNSSKIYTGDTIICLPEVYYEVGDNDEECSIDNYIDCTRSSHEHYGQNAIYYSDSNNVKEYLDNNKLIYSHTYNYVHRNNMQSYIDYEDGTMINSSVGASYDVSSANYIDKPVTLQVDNLSSISDKDACVLISPVFISQYKLTIDIVDSQTNETIGSYDSYIDNYYKDITYDDVVNETKLAKYNIDKDNIAILANITDTSSNNYSRVFNNSDATDSIALYVEYGEVNNKIIISVNPYTLKYNTMDNDNSTLEVPVYVYSNKWSSFTGYTLSISADDLVKTGYTFYKWSTTSLDDALANDDESDTTMYNSESYRKFSKHRDASGAYTLSSSHTINTYTFNNLVDYVDSYGVINLYGVWQPNQNMIGFSNYFNVSYYDTGYIPSNKGYNYVYTDDKLTKPNVDPSLTSEYRDQYTFQYWYIDNDENAALIADGKAPVKYDFDTPVKESFTLKDYWTTKNVCTVSFTNTFDMDMYTEFPTTKTVEKGETLSMDYYMYLVYPYSNRFTFKYWYIDNDSNRELLANGSAPEKFHFDLGVNAAYPATVITESITLKDYWVYSSGGVWVNGTGSNSTAHKATFYPRNGQDTFTEYENIYSGLLDKPTGIYREGYKLLGWTEDSTWTTDSDYYPTYWDFYNDWVEKDVELYAVWIPKTSRTLTLKFVDTTFNTVTSDMIVTYYIEDIQGLSIYEYPTVTLPKLESPLKTKLFIAWDYNSGQYSYNVPLTIDNFVNSVYDLYNDNEVTLEAEWADTSASQPSTEPDPEPDTEPQSEPSTEETSTEETSSEPESEPSTEETSSESESEPEPQSEPASTPIVPIQTEVPSEPASESEPSTEETSSEPQSEPENEQPVEISQTQEISETVETESETESETEPASEIQRDTANMIVEENDDTLYVGTIDSDKDNQKSALARFVEAVKTVAIVLSISLIALIGLLGLLLILLAFRKRVKVLNNKNVDMYKDDKYEVVYKTSVKGEGNKVNELFKQEDRVWQLHIPENIIVNRVTDDFRIELNKSFCKRYNGEQLIVILDNEDDAMIKQFGFVIDKDEPVVKFGYNED